MARVETTAPPSPITPGLLTPDCLPSLDVSAQETAMDGGDRGPEQHCVSTTPGVEVAGMEILSKL